ncbi:MAG: sel1 repeat family protein [Candidatus Competibacteraceae bacterium]|nr:sel1 repeat family protein [Candidatus Competibacteraceae bacterium]
MIVRRYCLILGSLLLAACDPQQAQYRTAMQQLFQRDYRAGAATLTSLAENGHPPSQFRLGFLYRTGLGVPRSARLANYWFEKAAQQGDVGGQYWLAESYRRGQGLPVSPELAYAGFYRLAERGYAPAQYQVALALAEGRGVARNNGHAITWLQRAVAGGHPEAARRLAQAYRNGELGLPQDPLQAAEWERKIQPARF